MASQYALDVLLKLSEDYKDFNSSPIEAQNIPSALDFCKHVNKGYPCVYNAYQVNSLQVNGSCDALPYCAALKWNVDDLVQKVVQDVDIAVTPTGRADAVHTNESNNQQVFLQPANVPMSMKKFFDLLAFARTTQSSLSPSSPVHYLQSQNSNLTSTPLSPLLKDVPQNFPFAADVLGDPEAVNIWIGDERSVTSTHRDPYENLYLVLRGSKEFTLWPSVDELAMNAQMVRTGHWTYHCDDEQDPPQPRFSIVLDEPEHAADEPPIIPWVSVDTDIEPSQSKDPLYRYASPRTVTVQAGQILYLPSGWYHQVKQYCGTWDDGSWSPCIAVNYWYDMEYEGEKYVMRQLVSRLVERAQEEIRAGSTEGMQSDPASL